MQEILNKIGLLLEQNKNIDYSNLVLPDSVKKFINDVQIVDLKKIYGEIHLISRKLYDVYINFNGKKKNLLGVIDNEIENNNDSYIAKHDKDKKKECLERNIVLNKRLLSIFANLNTLIICELSTNINYNQLFASYVPLYEDISRLKNGIKYIINISSSKRHVKFYDELFVYGVDVNYFLGKFYIYMAINGNNHLVKDIVLYLIEDNDVVSIRYYDQSFDFIYKNGNLIGPKNCIYVKFIKDNIYELKNSKLVRVNVLE